MPKVSVIVPVYCVEGYIERCARSLFEQTLDDMEFVFIDDCSPDNSINALINIVNQYPHLKKNITILKNIKNLGPSATRNRGIEVSKGDYIIFCDSDDYVELDAYEIMYNEAVQKQADIVACGVCLSADRCEKYVLYSSNETLTKCSLYDIRKLEGVLYSSSCNKLVKRSLFKEHSICFHDDIRMWDDLFITFKLRYFAHVVTIVNLPLYHYWNRDGSLVKSKVLEKWASQRRCADLIEAFIRKHNQYDSFKIVIEFLKFRANDILFCDEYIETWVKNTKESTIRLFIPFYGIMRTMMYYIVKYFGLRGWRLLTVYRKIKQIIINYGRHFNTKLQ